MGANLPVVFYRSQAIVTKNRVYLLGGHTGAAGIATVCTAPVNSDGTLGEWATGTSLPTTLYGAPVIVTKSRVYLSGGVNSGGFTSTVYTAPFAGGMNDYSLLTDSVNFYLPTLTPEEPNTHAYIKF